MSENELREIDRRVAVELGIASRCNTPKHWWLTGPTMLPVGVFGCEEDAWLKMCPFYTTDPAAADLVRQEIEKQGWMLTRIDYKSKRPLPAYPNQHRAQVLTRDDADGKWEFWGTDDENPHLALCLAFLAACEATKGEATP